MSGERWPALMSREHACEYLDIGVTLFNGLVASEQIKSVRIGAAIRYRKTDLDNFVDRLEEGRGKFRGKVDR